MEGVLIIMRLAAVALAAAASLGHAHDERPQYGGIVQSVKDIAYEIASHEGGLMLYVEDHGNPVPMAGVAGKLVVTKGSHRIETGLKLVGENRMFASGARLHAGYKVTALLQMPSGRLVVVQFPAK